MRNLARTLPLLLLLSFAAPKAEPFEEARQLLKQGKLEEAKSEAMHVLAEHPYSTKGYQVLFDVAEASSNIEDQLRWGKWMYWSSSFGGESGKASAIAAQLDSLYPEWNADQPILAEWKTSATEAAVMVARDRLYRSAGHVIGRLVDYDPNDAKLGKEYDKLAARAGDMLSGGAFVAERVRRRSPAWIERQNLSHADWENAFDRKTKHYQIITNLDYEFYETVSVVMEDMARFYRKIYDYRKKAPRVTLAIHRKRSDFDKFCHEELGGSLPTGVLGWFYDREMVVAAFQDKDFNITRDMLWSTLFHEASHEFMYLKTEAKTKVDPPTWLNEGTASFFEGCELKSDGTIVKNKPAALRVREWEQIDSGSSRHSIAEVISYPGPGSYPGSMYSYGWALVYFLLNYEESDSRLDAKTGDEIPDVIPAGQLVYRDAYLKYLNYYTRKPKRNGPTPLELAKEYFVEDVADPDIPDWDAFENRWRRFTRALVRESKAGPELADLLLARARGYLEINDWERAGIAAEQADDKRPQDGEAYRILALANAGAGQADEAAYWMLRTWEASLASGKPEAAEKAESWLLENDAGTLVELFCIPTRNAFDGILKNMEQALQKGHPELALLFASHIKRATGIQHASLQEKVQQARDLSSQDLRLWLTAFPHGSITRRPGRVQQMSDDSVLLFAPKKRKTTFRPQRQSLARLEPPFDLRGSVQVDGKSPAEIEFGISTNEAPQASMTFENGAAISLFDIDVSYDLESQGRQILTTKGVHTRRLAPTQEFHFEFLMNPEGGGVLRVGEDAEINIPKRWSESRLKGAFRIGVTQDTAAKFSNLQVRTQHPFWPVENQEK